MADKPTPEELKELREDVLNHTQRTETKNAKIIFDGRQYSIRFPKKFIDEAQVNPEDDYFKITLFIPEYSTGNKPDLNATLIRKNEETET